MTGGFAVLRKAVVAASCLTPIAVGRAQDPYSSLVTAAAAVPALRREVSIDVRGEALGAALRRVARAAELDFVLDGALPELLTPVSVQLDRTTVRDALTALIAEAGALHRVEVVVVWPATLIVRAVLPDSGPANSRDVVTPGTITGIITDAVTGSPVVGAEVVVDSEPWIARTDQGGRFAVGRVVPGSHTVVVRRIGFSPLRIPRVAVGSRERRHVAVTLRPTPLKLDQLVVTTATYSAFADAIRPPVVTRDHLERIPHFGEDAFRAVAGLPGVSTDDFSSTLHVRGGSGDDLRITLDGVELIDPYHLRAVGGMFSLVDAHAVGEMTLAAGDVGAEHGNQLAGVLAIESLRPEDARLGAEAVADVHHVSAATHGLLPRVGGSWLVAARYGFPDVILHRANVTGDVSARFADLLAKATVSRGDDTLTFHALIARDRLQRGVDDGSYLDDASSHGYLWATARSRIGSRTTVGTTASLGMLSGSANAAGVATTSTPFVDYLPVVAVDDHRTTRVVALRQDWRATVSNAWVATWGAELTRSRATAGYALDSAPARSPLPSNVSSAARVRREVSSQATRGGVYTSHRLRLTSRAVADVGIRYDAHDATREHVWSPRVYASYRLSPRTTVRGGWGRYAQFDRLYDIDLAHADTMLERGDRADHLSFGFEHEPSAGVTLRAELYDRRQWRVRPRFYRAPSSATLFPELTDVPFRLAPAWRRTRGIETSMSSREMSALGWTASYAYAVARERVGATIVRGPFDDRHSVRLEWWLAPRSAWRAGGAWSYRSGWAATDRAIDVRRDGDTVRVATLLGAYNQRDHGRYSRLDLRLERVWTGHAGTISIFGDIYNVLDQLNTHAFERADYMAVTASGEQGPIAVSRTSEAWSVPMLGPLVTVGVRWKR